MNFQVASRFIVPLATSLIAFASAPSLAGDLTVDVHGIRAQRGLLKIAVVDSKEAFDGNAAPVQSSGAPAEGATARFEFKNLKPGSYAVMITHDENGNGKLDSNLMGMPLEGFGFSNNPRVMRKPTWEEARFEVTDATTVIEIELH